jgi:hypothetical protein
VYTLRIPRMEIIICVLASRSSSINGLGGSESCLAGKGNAPLRKTLPLHHSYRSDSAGLTLAARRAGK